MSCSREGVRWSLALWIAGEIKLCKKWTDGDNINLGVASSATEASALAFVKVYN